MQITQTVISLQIARHRASAYGKAAFAARSLSSPDKLPLVWAPTVGGRIIWATRPRTLEGWAGLGWSNCVSHSRGSPHGGLIECFNCRKWTYSPMRSNQYRWGSRTTRPGLGLDCFPLCETSTPESCSFYKEALRRESPKGSNDVLLMAKISPCRDVNGNVIFVGEGSKTVDTQRPHADLSRPRSPRDQTPAP